MKSLFVNVFCDFDTKPVFYAEIEIEINENRISRKSDGTASFQLCMDGKDAEILSCKVYDWADVEKVADGLVEKGTVSLQEVVPEISPWRLIKLVKDMEIDLIKMMERMLIPNAIFGKIRQINQENLKEKHGNGN